MARYNVRYVDFLRTPGFSLKLLATVLAALALFRITESNDPLQLRGVVGQNVTFHCPHNKHKSIRVFYLQRNNVFVNGYHVYKNIPAPIWNNTELNGGTDVHMYQIHISHSGNYLCYVQYDDYATDNTYIHLNVTGNYTKPSTNVTCENHGCRVTCASGGGFPSYKVTWHVEVAENSSGLMWRVVSSSERSDPDTMLVNSSSTAFFNCSEEKWKFVSCSVDNVTSDTFSVCEDPHNVGQHVTYIVAAALICATIFIVTGAVVGLKCGKKKTTGAGKSGSAMEELSLNSPKGDEEAS